MPEFVKVARWGDIGEGGSRVVEVAGKEVVLFKVQGKIFALNNVCPHRGGPLAEGVLSGSEVICPWHAWAFDLGTGAYTFAPELRVETFEVRVEDGEILIRV
jgi:NAD(P)H-dependent nitrite reductase small subunit